MNEAEFHRLGDKTLELFEHALEAADADGALDAECTNGVLTISLENGKQFIVNKHAPSQRIWLSSPISGGLHFTYDGGVWKLADGRVLQALLALELKELANITVEFA